MAKLIEFNKEARHGFERDMNTLTDAIKVTLGPKNRNVALEKKWGVLAITSDGVSITKEIELDDPYGKIGAELVKEVAKKTDDVAGDGTTTAIIMAQTMVREGLRNVTVGANPMALKKDTEAAVAAIIEELSGLVTDVETEEQVAATTSIFAADPSASETIAEAMGKVGKEGVITAEESNTFGLELELTKGTRFGKDYISLYFATNTERMEATLDDPYILIVNSKISSLKDLLPVLEEVMQSGKSLLVVTEDVEGEALADLTVNKLRGTPKSITVKTPGFGDCHKATLSDIAILTGGQVIAKEVGLSLETITLDLLGRAHRVIATKDECIIADDNGVQTQIESRIAQIRREIENSDSDYDREKLQEHLAKLVDGITVIKIGAATEAELRGRKHRIGDAVRSAKATVEEGIVPDGGVTLLQTSKAAKVEGLDDDGMAGANIVFTTAQAPLRQIAMNAGLEDGVIAEKIAGLPKGRGLDAATGKYVDVVATGIIDPTRVTRSALQNAASVATLSLTTEAIIADKPEKVLVAAGVLGMDEMGGMGGF